MSSSTYSKVFKQAKEDGYRLAPSHPSAYSAGKKTRFAAVFTKDPGYGNFMTRHGLSASKYQEVVEDMVAKGCVQLRVLAAEVRRLLWDKLSSLSSRNSPIESGSAPVHTRGRVCRRSEFVRILTTKTKTEHGTMGRCLGRIPPLTTELVGGQIELLELPQLSNRVRERSCACERARVSSGVNLWEF